MLKIIFGVGAFVLVGLAAAGLLLAFFWFVAWFLSGGP